MIVLCDWGEKISSLVQQTRAQMKKNGITRLRELALSELRNHLGAVTDVMLKILNFGVTCHWTLKGCTVEVVSTKSLTSIKQ